jgi:hypothetical protein
MELNVELKIDIQPGKRASWVAHTNRFHFPGWAGTAIGEGPSPGEALAALAKEVNEIARKAMQPSAPEEERLIGILTREDPTEDVP